MRLSEKRIKQIVSAYKDFINNPYADGYTRVALEGRYGMSIKQMAKIYEEYRPKKILTDTQILKVISKIVKSVGAYDSQGEKLNEIEEILKDNGKL